MQHGCAAGWLRAPVAVRLYRRHSYMADNMPLCSCKGDRMLTRSMQRHCQAQHAAQHTGGCAARAAAGSLADLRPAPAPPADCYHSQ